jgi:hypothetical protein
VENQKVQCLEAGEPVVKRDQPQSGALGKRSQIRVRPHVSVQKTGHLAGPMSFSQTHIRIKASQRQPELSALPLGGFSVIVK